VTTTKPLPAHGTPARANGRYRAGIKPCHCKPCCAAIRAYRKRRNVLIERGHTLTVDAAPIAAHLQKLLAAGDSLPSISRRIGYAYSPLWRVATGQQKKLRTAYAERILALQPGLATGAFTDATGSMRRLRALTAMKHSLETIATDSGLSTSVIGTIITGRRTRITQETADAVAATYRRLHMTPGSSARAGNRAAREGWAPPLAWTDNIDDPDAFPDFTGRCGTPQGYQAHRGSGIPACRPCKDAEAVASAERKARRATAARQGLAA